jgi:hypothetical protein
LSEPISFIIDVAPLDHRDMERTQRKVLEVVRELVDDGVQIRGGIGMVIRESRETVLGVVRA